MIPKPLKNAWQGAEDEAALLPEPKVVARWCENKRLRLASMLRRFDCAYMPFAQFEDCNVGSLKKQKAAFARNKERKGVLLPHMGAWALRGLSMFAALFTAERIQSLGIDTSLLQAGFAICLTLCFLFCLVMWAGWLGLTFLND